jgi:hypothetical protein
MLRTVVSLRPCGSSVNGLNCGIRVLAADQGARTEIRYAQAFRQPIKVHVARLIAWHRYAAAGLEQGGEAQFVRAGRLVSGGALCGFGVAAAVVAEALALHASAWHRTGAVSWGPATNMFGVLVLMLTGAFDVPHGILRNALSIFGVGCVAVGAFIVFFA